MNNLSHPFRAYSRNSYNWAEVPIDIKLQQRYNDIVAIGGGAPPPVGGGDPTNAIADSSGFTLVDSSGYTLVDNNDN